LLPSSKLDEDLDRFAFVHRPVAVRDVIERPDPIEDAAGFDPAVAPPGRAMLRAVNVDCS